MRRSDFAHRGQHVARPRHAAEESEIVPIHDDAVERAPQRLDVPYREYPSSLHVGSEEVVLGWLGPRGVAPKRMPKADATELAPKNRQDPSARIAARGVFFACILW